MKKIFSLFIALMACVNTVFASEYGVLVNGKMFYESEYVGVFEGFEQHLAHVQLNAGDYCQLYDAESEAAWAVDLNKYSEDGFTRNGDQYKVSVTGCYNFYIKLKYQADELYIGVGTDCGAGVDINPEETEYASAVPEQCTDVMLQAFYWDSYNGNASSTLYGHTKWIDFLNANNGTSAEEIGKWFNLIWLPPMSKSTGGTGYLPVNYGVLDSDWGTTANLKKFIAALHENGAKVIADIVINHAGNKYSWCDFDAYNFGKYGTFNPDASWICQTDEVNTDPHAGYCQGAATGNDDDGYGDEANYPAARDWDHTNPNVQAMFHAYLKWLRKDIRIDGFRYDYCKGYHNSHINDYNKEANAYFSVMEVWDGNVNALQNHLNDADWNTTTFDFALKYTAFNDGIANDNYCALKGAGLQGIGKGRYAVTFVDNHDTFQRGEGNEFCGDGNSMTMCKDKILECYAYLLSMPGIPCVFFPHWVSCKDEIKAMINARYKTGVHSESAVSEECGNGYYKATVIGKNGEIRVLIGPNSGYNNIPAGYKLAVKGANYGVYYKLISGRNDKDQPSKDYTFLFTNGNDGSEIDSYSVQFYLPTPPEITGFAFLKWIVVGGDLEDTVVFQAVYEANDPTSTPEVVTNPSNPAQKLIRNGSVYILTDDSRTYTLTGQAVK